jgi:hypothetical protein
MPGETNCPTAIDKMETVIKVLDEYESKGGLPTLKNPCDQEELDKYLTMNRDHIEKLSGQDCVQIAYRLDQTAFYIQRLYNREQARIAWAKAQLAEVIAPQIGQYNDFWKHEVKVALVVKNNSYASKLNDIINYATQRVQRLSGLTNTLNNLSNTLKAVQRSKYVHQGPN